MEKRFANENFPPDIQAKADQMNLEESAVGAWTYPELPFKADCTGTEFQSRIRPQLVELMAKYMYGEIPPRPEFMEFVTTAEGEAFDGLAIRREIDIICRHQGQKRKIQLLLYVPKAASRPVPVFFGLNFKGNHATTFDPGVTFHPFTPYNDYGSPRLCDSRVDENQRGLQSDRFCYETLLQHGFAAATACYYDIYPDHPDGFPASILSMYISESEWNSPQRNTGAVSAWAWGISRCLDCLEAQKEIDVQKMCVHGHSRLGKTALWAGANDSRIALTVSNCSGTCGAKMCHRYFGEDFAWIGQWNPHWFNAEFYRYINRDLEFPVDQHFLMAAIAPRLLYVASATEDVWADPRGEFAAAVAAAPAWQISGGVGLGTTEFPQPDTLIGHEIGYFYRTGVHNFTPSNWAALLEFAEKNLQ